MWAGPAVVFLCNKRYWHTFKWYSIINLFDSGTNKARPGPYHFEAPHCLATSKTHERQLHWIWLFEVSTLCSSALIEVLNIRSRIKNQEQALTMLSAQPAQPQPAEKSWRQHGQMWDRQRQHGNSLYTRPWSCKTNEWKKPNKYH